MKIKLILLSSLLLSACGLVPNKPVNVAMLNENLTLATDAQYNPNEAFRLVLVGVDDSHGVSKVSLSSQAVAKMKQVMLKNGVNILNVERNVRNQLTSEIQLIEAGGVSQFTLPDAANMATRGEIVSINIATSFNDKEKNVVTGDGLPTYKPAHCTYKAKISGVFVFYYVDPLKKYKTVSFDGTASQDIPGESCPDLSATQKSNLYSRAIDKAIDGSEAMVMNAMARKGYVISSYEDMKSKKSYFRLSVSPDQGAIPGVSVEFIELRKSPTNKIDEIPFGEGKIACTNHRDAAYVEVSDPIVKAKVKRNTPIKLKYQDDPIWIATVKNLFPCNP